MTNLTVRHAGVPNSISVVLPCLNERLAIAYCISAGLTAIAALGLPGEIIVVDNSSIDQTGQAATAAGAIVLHEERRGYGRACRKGAEFASGEIIVFCDGDASYDLRELTEIVSPILSGAYDFVAGSRINGIIEHGAMPALHRYFGTPILTWALNRRSSRSWSDSQTGYLAMRSWAYQGMSTQSNGHEFTTELLFRADQMDLHTIEVPITYRPRVGTSKLRPVRDALRHLRFILSAT